MAKLAMGSVARHYTSGYEQYLKKKTKLKFTEGSWKEAPIVPKLCEDGNPAPAAVLHPHKADPQVCWWDCPGTRTALLTISLLSQEPVRSRRGKTAL